MWKKSMSSLRVLPAIINCFCLPIYAKPVPSSSRKRVSCFSSSVSRASSLYPSSSEMKPKS